MEIHAWPVPRSFRGAGRAGAGIIDPVSTFDFRATEFKSRNPDKVAFAIKASQHLR
jgi:hypothetical protein